MRMIIPTSAQKNSSIDFQMLGRTVLAVGSEAIERISTLKIGVIAVGGLGIIVIELLARLGAKNIIINDFDNVDHSNLNRLTSATPIDAKLKTPKTMLAARLIYGINPETELQIVDGDFLLEENQRPFEDCDVIFCCSDSVAVRRAFNVLCLSRGIEGYDLGCGVKVDNGKMVACGGQVVRIVPGRNYCIECCGLFDLSKADAEFMDPEEAKRQMEMGYVSGANVPQPSVYALNMMVASQAVWWFLRIMAGEQLDFDGIYIDGMTFRTNPWSEKADLYEKGINNCPVCGKDGIEFGGDEVGLLIRDNSTIDAIPGNNPDAAQAGVTGKAQISVSSPQEPDPNSYFPNEENKGIPPDSASSEKNTVSKNPDQYHGRISSSISIILKHSLPITY
jgi:molybdopterin/thiamine biosynthesis adenylyltransferase